MALCLTVLMHLKSKTGTKLHHFHQRIVKLRCTKNGVACMIDGYVVPEKMELSRKG